MVGGADAGRERADEAMKREVLDTYGTLCGKGAGAKVEIATCLAGICS